MAIRAIVFHHGPIRLEADDPAELQLVDADGKPFGLAGRKAIGLCRCGLAANKPFCDGAHKRQGFQSECPARDLPAPPPPKVG